MYYKCNSKCNGMLALIPGCQVSYFFLFSEKFLFFPIFHQNSYFFLFFSSFFQLSYYFFSKVKRSVQNKENQLLGKRDSKFVIFPTKMIT